VYTGNCIKGSNPFLSARGNRLADRVKRFFAVSRVNAVFGCIWKNWSIKESTETGN